MTQATIEEAHEAFRAEMEATIKNLYDERAELTQYRHKQARKCWETYGSISVLLYKCLRLINTLVEENRKLREESMQEKSLNRELARTRFHPVAKAHLN